VVLGTFEKDIYESQKIFSEIDKLAQLENGKEDRMEIGYYNNLIAFYSQFVCINSTNKFKNSYHNYFFYYFRFSSLSKQFYIPFKHKITIAFLACYFFQNSQFHKIVN